MPIRIITGLPGHGKTLRMVDELHDAAKAATRPLFQCGIAGLEPGLATELRDPMEWNAHDPNGEPTCDCHGDGHLHAHVVPDGSLIFVDEAWKWFGHLHNASGQKTPKHVLDFAEHRHRGLDFVMTTQGPGQIYPFLRTLIEGHTHVVRIMGMETANLFNWPELNDDVKSKSMREAAHKVLWTYPKDRFGSYKSATVHTIKRKVPWRVILIPASVIGAILAGWIAYNQLRPDAMAARSSEAITGEASGLPGVSPLSAPVDVMPTLDPHDPEAVKQYFQQFVPRNAAIPASAPAYDNREVVAEPKVFCMVAGAGAGADGQQLGDSCRCLTEQGTAYTMQPAMCRLLASNGAPYDPFKEPERESRNGLDRGDGGTPSVTPSASTSGVIEGEQIAAYGDLAVGG